MLPVSNIAKRVLLNMHAREQRDALLDGLGRRPPGPLLHFAAAGHGHRKPGGRSRQLGLQLDDLRSRGGRGLP